MTSGWSSGYGDGHPLGRRFGCDGDPVLIASSLASWVLGSLLFGGQLGIVGAKLATVPHNILFLPIGCSDGRHLGWLAEPVTAP